MDTHFKGPRGEYRCIHYSVDGWNVERIIASDTLGDKIHVVSSGMTHDDALKHAKELSGLHEPPEVVEHVIHGSGGIFRVFPAEEFLWCVEELHSKIEPNGNVRAWTDIVGYYKSNETAMGIAEKAAGLPDPNAPDRRGLVAHSRAQA